MKRYLPFVIVALVALATIGSGAMLYRARRPHVLSIPENKTLSAKSDADAPHIRGTPDAPVTLDEYGDFQCPPCGMFATFLGQLENEYDSRLRVVFRNFPLAMHQHAREAALAAEAAGLQGRFWEMHDMLFQEQAVWSSASDAGTLFDSYAETLGLDLNQFRKDLKSDKVRQRIESDQARASVLGVKVAPTLFIDKHQVGTNEGTPEKVHKLIDDAVKEKISTSEKK